MIEEWVASLASVALILGLVYWTSRIYASRPNE
jgi:hypothetical protein